MSKTKEFIERYYFVIFTYCLTFLPPLFKGEITFSDSPSYIDNTIFVAPLYGYLVDIMQFLFGETNFKVIVAVQFVLFFHLLFFYLLKISKLLNLEEAQRLLFIFVVCLIYSQYMAIQTEAVAYPIFFAIIYYALALIKGTDFKKYLYLLILTTILCLIRAQYVFMFPLIFLSLVLFRKKISSWVAYKAYGILIISLLVSLFATNSVNYFRYGKFIGPQLFGLNFISTPAYLMQKEDAALFDDELTKKIFLSSLDQLQKENAVKYCDKSKWEKPKKENYDNIAKNFSFWNPKVWNKYYESELKVYELRKLKSYKSMLSNNDDICEYSDKKHFLDTTASRFHSFLIASQNNGVTDLQQINKITTEISIKLIKSRFYDWVKHCLFVSLLDFEGSNPVYLIIIVSLAGLFCINIRIKGLYNNKNNYILLGFILHLSNSILLGFISMAHPRYVGFTIAILISSLIISFYDLYLKLASKFKTLKH